MKERFEMRAEKEWIDKLDAYAAQRGLSRAAAARKLMQMGLNSVRFAEYAAEAAELRKR